MYTEPFELDRAQCLAFLGSVGVGRAVLCQGHSGQVSVLPVNFVLDGGHVVIRTGDGSLLAAARQGVHVTFQADAFDQSGVGNGWSVTVSGRAHEATGAVLHRLTALPLVPIAGGRRDHYVLVAVESMEGRRVGGPSRIPSPGPLPVPAQHDATRSGPAVRHARTALPDLGAAP